MNLLQEILHALADKAQFVEDVRAEVKDKIDQLHSTSAEPAEEPATVEARADLPDPVEAPSL